ncbi:MAG: TIR domain-containing protein [Candidatus Fonsibacter sp.]|nr:TIR domain-containing protein [Candidatus Fonsibacter sp.]
MKLFVCNRSKDRILSKQVVDELLTKSENSVAIQQEIQQSETWQKKVEQKMQESDFIVFLLGADTFESQQIIWEYAKAKDLNKQIIGYKLSDASEQSILFCQGFQVFENAKHCIKFLKKTYDDDRKLKLDQYQIMISSTEKVTENRMKVNNLFFTITSSILSVGFVLGKTFGFSIKAMLGMFTLTFLSLIVSYFWEKLILSYALLNKGKFKVIDKIEKQLRTNMFENEWKILTQEINYEPNSITEIKIIEYFRIFIYIFGIIELVYIGFLFHQTLPKCNC